MYQSRLRPGHLLPERDVEVDFVEGQPVMRTIAGEIPKGRPRRGEAKRISTVPYIPIHFDAETRDKKRERADFERLRRTHPWYEYLLA